MKRKKYLVMGFALFSMFFGAGNLIFPPSLGLVSGQSWKIALLGFLTTGVGLPFLAIYAVSKTEGSVFTFAGKVSNKFSMIFNSLLILAIGPLLAIPRTGAVTYEMGILPFSPNFNKWIFGIIYFGLTIFFAIKPSKMLDRLGKILTPMILITLVLIIGGGLIKPFGMINKDLILNGAYIKGFFEGYQTMDALGGIIMGAVMIDLIKTKGFEKKEEGIALFNTSLIAGILLAVIYGGLVFLGAKSGSLYTGEIGRTTLLSNLAILTLGENGKIVLGLLVAFACLTTSIGLVATVGNFFSKHTKFKYETIVITASIFSLFVANLGVDKIVKVSIPILVFLFPIAIVLIIMNSFSQKIKRRGAYIGGVMGAGIVSSIEALNALGIKNEFLMNLYNKIPFAKEGYGFIIPSVVLASLLHFVIKEEV